MKIFYLIPWSIGYECREKKPDRDEHIEVISKSNFDLALEEIACLRSVLSEWDQDKSCSIQWNRANDLAASRKV